MAKDPLFEHLGKVKMTPSQLLEVNHVVTVDAAGTQTSGVKLTLATGDDVETRFIGRDDALKLLVLLIRRLSAAGEPAAMQLAAFCDSRLREDPDK